MDILSEVSENSKLSQQYPGFIHIFSGCHDPSICEIYRKTIDHVEMLTKSAGIVMRNCLFPINAILYITASVFNYVSSNFCNKALLQIFPMA